LYEAQLGLIAKLTGCKFAVPTFSGFGPDDIQELITGLGLPQDLRMNLFDGRTGEAYAQRVTVGYMNLLKLVHMVEDKIHARSVGPYSLITQQPL
jgi:DNA-directed RNA polymerase subunit beta